MIILGIETSCDETAVALLEHDGEKPRLLADLVASQVDLHARFGGVVPELASREHVRTLPPLVDQAMAEAGVRWSEIGRVAVTAGPGLMGALLVGVSYARGAAAVNGVPLVPIHHLEAHLLAPGLAEEGLPPFPFICLLVSGGHTMLVRVDGLGRYRVLGQTVDDAAGECFDKCARLLGCGYPGGPQIARMAQDGDASRFALPRPMLKRGLDFSFSGLKTAVMYAMKDGDFDMSERQCRLDMAAAIEAAIGDVLSIKAVRAARQQGVRHLVLAGGVAANRYLRERLHALAQSSGIRLVVPDLRHCTDNAAMVAHAAWLRCQARMRFPSAWDARARWELEHLERMQD